MFCFKSLSLSLSLSCPVQSSLCLCFCLCQTNLHMRVARQTPPNRIKTTRTPLCHRSSWVLRRPIACGVHCPFGAAEVTKSSTSLEDQRSHGHSIAFRFLRFPSNCSRPCFRRTFVVSFCMRAPHADVYPELLQVLSVSVSVSVSLCLCVSVSLCLCFCVSVSLFLCLCLCVCLCLCPVVIPCTHHCTLQPFMTFQFSGGRMRQPSRHHMVESLLLHGCPALSNTLSPTVTSWCELLVPCADIGLHTGVQCHSVLNLCVQPTVYAQCHQFTCSGGPRSDCHR